MMFFPSSVSGCLSFSSSCPCLYDERARVRDLWKFDEFKHARCQRQQVHDILLDDDGIARLADAGALNRSNAAEAATAAE